MPTTKPVFLLPVLLLACGAPAEPPPVAGPDTEVADPTDDCVPSAEVCDGIDNDCDGLVDNDPEDGVASFPDADGDGFGAADGEVVTCDAIEGFVREGGDCDDARADINPAAVELCDGIDNDCDATTSEAGTATLLTETGPEDRTGALTGTPEEPARVELTTPGTLQICEGVWFAHLDLQADVDVVGIAGSEDTVLDGSRLGTVIAITDVDATLRGLTLRNGDGGESCGGAVCMDGGALDGSDVVMVDNVAQSGGAMRVDEGTVTLSDVELSDNEATGTGGALFVSASTLSLVDATLRRNSANRGGAVDARSSSLTLDRVDVEDSTATQAAGAFQLSSGTLLLRDSRIVGSVADNEGGAMRASGAIDLRLENSVLEGNTSRLGPAIMFRGSPDAVLTCQGAVGATSGIFGNVATGEQTGAIHLTNGTFVAEDCDLVDPVTGTDNAPTDLRLGGQQVDTFGEDTNVICTLEGCSP
ncbi:MAG: putative metal-binding motif-containing protein [Myxococcota bacterium]